MITTNFKQICASMLQTVGSVTTGLLPLKGVDGTTYYFSTKFNNNYPYTVTYSLSQSATSAGIVFGTDNSPESDSDYKLGSQITSGLSATVAYTRGLDANGSPYLEYTIVLGNTGTESVTINEIGYYQTVTVCTAQMSSSTSNKVICLDRTVLDDPVTIAAGAQKVIKYTL